MRLGKLLKLFRGAGLHVLADDQNHRRAYHATDWRQILERIVSKSRLHMRYDDQRSGRRKYDRIAIRLRASHRFDRQSACRAATVLDNDGLTQTF
jgi:isocitrate dehydrogenase kinase/phosphatase